MAHVNRLIAEVRIAQPACGHPDHGRFVGVGGCGAPIARGIAAGEATASAADPYVPGEIPCYTAEGVPYFTPPGDPC